MKILVLPGSLSRDGGGVFEVALRHSLFLQKAEGVDIEVIGKFDKNTIIDQPKWNAISTSTLRLSIPLIHHIKGLNNAIQQVNADIMHSHMLWTSQSRVVRKLHRKNGTPYIVSPHGMLDSWTLNFKKKFALAAFEFKSLSSASCIHALNYSEYETIRKLGFKNPVAIIPNGLDISPTTGLTPKERDQKKKLLFLSRIDPKKGIENLLEAISMIKEDFGTSWDLIIHGWGDSKYIQIIKDRIKELNLETFVYMKGPVFDEEKKSAFQSCDAFILPSHSEGFPMVVLEAWGAFKPVLMTKACNIPEGKAANAAIEISNSPKVLSKTLLEFIQLEDSTLLEMGENGHRLVNEKFTWDIVGNKLLSLYKWVLDEGEKPEFVMLN